ncbi:hypothetical protein [Paenibacillus elgii]|uniref:hypothetical protein n=1 Tax=Paenibacillus elgii TaxID=189691 RepID=UPI00203E9CDA|nr:hypothetical protein [Paenibacillus elgii]MCM3267854.1 hypothetical protein [Paenibacillus elgii]
MFCKAMRLLSNWFIFIVSIASVLGMIIYFYRVSDFTYSMNDSMKDKIELASWIFAGIMALISFLSLFIAFVYDNKHIEASRVLRQYYKPYGLTLETVRLSLNEYRTYISKGFMLNAIYSLLSLTSIISIIIWGISVNAFTEQVLKFDLWWDKEDILNFGLYLFWLILSLLLIGILFFVNIIRLNKDPVGKGFLPDYSKIRNVDFLVNKDADIGEIIFISSPRLDIYKYDNNNNEDSYELNVIFPIKLVNMKFIFKVYNNRELTFRCYGFIEEEHEEDEWLLLRDDTFINERLYEALYNEMYAELKVYDSRNSLISKLKLVGNKQGNTVSFVVERRYLNLFGRDIDKGLIESMKPGDSLKFQNEIAEITM